MSPLKVITGPCIIESEEFALNVANEVKRQLEGIEGVEVIFKASFDKANRTSIESFRGPGLEQGLRILERVGKETGLPLETDYHEPTQASALAEVVDVLQVPAFLCRQTDMVVAGAKACMQRGRSLNVKKGQFLAPWDTKNIVEKVRQVGEVDLWLTERGVSFGYNQLMVDMASFQVMGGYGARPIYDVTHSIQIPGAAPGGKATGGKREYLEVLAKSAVAAGARGLFIEVHPDPSKAKSDGPTALYLDQLGALVRQLVDIAQVVDRQPRLLPETKDIRY